MDGLLSLVIIIFGAVVTTSGVYNLIFIKDNDDKSLKKPVFKTLVGIIIGLAIVFIGIFMMTHSFFSI